MKPGEKLALVLVILIACAFIASFILVGIALRRMSFGPGVGL